MKYIKPTHDVLGLEKRVKLVLSSDKQDPSDLALINSLKLNTADAVYTLYRKPTQDSTLFWCTMKTGDHEVSTDDHLTSDTVVEPGEILCRITTSGAADGHASIDIFDDINQWGVYGNFRASIEVRNAADIVSASFKADGMENIHYQAFRGVRVKAEDKAVSSGESMTVNFPV